MELELQDYKDMEMNAIEELKNAEKMKLISETILAEAIKGIKKLKGETEEERIKRLEKESKDRFKNTTRPGA